MDEKGTCTQEKLVELNDLLGEASVATTSRICSALPITTVSMLAHSRVAIPCACSRRPSTAGIVRGGQIPLQEVVARRNIARSRATPGASISNSQKNRRGKMRLIRMLVPAALIIAVSRATQLSDFALR